MKQLIFILLLSFSGLSQSNPCDSILNGFGVDVLDCNVYTPVPWSVNGESFQWLNCDNAYAPFPGDTTYLFSGLYEGYVALEITIGNCVDTSNCQFSCFWGVEEINGKPKELVQIVDFMGRKTDPKPNMLLIYVYSDWTTEKVFRVE